MRLLLFALLGSVLALNWAPVAQSAPVPAYAVTPGGQVEYNYEALLYQLFGPDIFVCKNLVVKINGLPTTVHDWMVNADQFPKNEPRLDGDYWANCPSYAFTFTHFADSAFHEEPAWFAIKPGAGGPPFGADIVPAFINEHYVACNAKGTEVLGSFSGRGETLGCFPL